MKNINRTNFIYILVAASALSWIALSWINGIKLSSAMDFLKLIPNVVTIDSIFIVIFTKWLWRWKLLRRWLVPFPNLNGTWVGNIYSDWINPETQQKVLPIPVMLTIKQSFFSISCLMQTAEMKSYSYIEGFTINEERQIKQLSYSYTSKPRIVLNERSVPHDGTIIFDIIENPNKKLRGRYWTERKTKGEIELLFKSNRIAEDLIDEVKVHPVTELENRR